MESKKQYLEDELAKELKDGEIVIKLPSGVLKGNYFQDLKINPSALNSELQNQPARYAFWAMIVNLQRAFVERLKTELSEYEAQLYLYLRSQKSGSEKMTEKVIEATIMLDTKRRKMADELLRQRLKLEHLVSILTAFQQRKDMLMTLSANLRRELEAESDLR